MLSEEELVVAMEHERHRTLNIWRDAVGFARDVYALTRSFPSEEPQGSDHVTDNWNPRLWQDTVTPALTP